MSNRATSRLDSKLNNRKKSVTKYKKITHAHKACAYFLSGLFSWLKLGKIFYFDCNMLSPDSVAIVGHSYVRRLYDWMQYNDQDSFLFEPRCTTCDFWGKGGLKISSLSGAHVYRNGNKQSAGLPILEALRGSPPDLLVVDLGTNDLDQVHPDSDVLAKELVTKLVHHTGQWARDLGYPVKKILYCPVLPRGPGRYQATTPQFEANRVAFNNALEDECRCLNANGNRGYFSALVFHRHLTTNRVVTDYLMDGVHLNANGYRRYYYSLRHQIVAALKDLNN